MGHCGNGRTAMVQEPAFAEWLSEPLHRLVIRRADHCGLENCMAPKHCIYGVMFYNYIHDLPPPQFPSE